MKGKSMKKKAQVSTDLAQLEKTLADVRAVHEANKKLLKSNLFQGNNILIEGIAVEKKMIDELVAKIAIEKGLSTKARNFISTIEKLLTKHFPKQATATAVVRTTNIIKGVEVAETLLNVHVYSTGKEAKFRKLAQTFIDEARKIRWASDLPAVILSVRNIGWRLAARVAKQAPKPPKEIKIPKVKKPKVVKPPKVKKPKAPKPPKVKKETKKERIGRLEATTKFLGKDAPVKPKKEKKVSKPKKALKTPKAEVKRVKRAYKKRSK